MWSDVGAQEDDHGKVRKMRRSTAVHAQEMRAAQADFDGRMAFVVLRRGARRGRCYYASPRSVSHRKLWLTADESRE